MDEQTPKYSEKEFNQEMAKPEVVKFYILPDNMSFREFFKEWEEGIDNTGGA